MIAILIIDNLLIYFVVSPVVPQKLVYSQVVQYPVRYVAPVQGASYPTAMSTSNTSSATSSPTHSRVRSTSASDLKQMPILNNISESNQEFNTSQIDTETLNSEWTTSNAMTDDATTICTATDNTVIDDTDHSSASDVDTNTYQSENAPTSDNNTIDNNFVASDNSSAVSATNQNATETVLATIVSASNDPGTSTARAVDPETEDGAWALLQELSPEPDAEIVSEEVSFLILIYCA